ncbi:unnamed protein product [Arctia plantaginis]|uniref:Uncharacterized protein n=1 Tax=Arctia plantaginis TaxID=874455 RepID=A0A8S0YWN8_ARCPL|nr:unnamed protein product [Arctia plantaginis]
MAGRVMPAFLNPRTYSKSNVPLLGALIDYIEISLVYLRTKTFTEAEKLHAKTTKATLSATFLAAVCLLLGVACNVKFEVVTMNEEPLPKDLHLMVMSKSDKLYIDDIDASSKCLGVHSIGEL